jgi:hypothetical protein
MPLDGLLQYRRRSRERLDDGETSGALALGFAFSGRPGQVYNEAAFRHFLDLERKRSSRSGRSFFVLLVGMKALRSAAGSIPFSLSGRLFEALTESVREVDFVGWYREQQVAGAVLVLGGEAPPADAQRQIAARVSATLRESLPEDAVDRLRIRVLHARRRTTC